MSQDMPERMWVSAKGHASETVSGQAAGAIYTEYVRVERAEKAKVELAAIKRAFAQLKERGYKIVPREATDKMCDEGFKYSGGYEDKIWEYMYDASPEVDIEALLKGKP